MLNAKNVSLMGKDIRLRYRVKACIRAVNISASSIVHHVTKVIEEFYVKYIGVRAMILSGLEIKKRIGKQIVIDPFDEKKLNPNSYNLCLANELLEYDTKILDMQKRNNVKKILIPENGLVLKANKLYLGRTIEYTRTENLVPMLEGRSSIGRLGIFIHVTAGFGDVGFSGFWTLEIFCIQPVRIYPNVEVCQIYFHTIKGEYEKYKSGKYQNNMGIQESMLYKDFY